MGKWRPTPVAYVREVNMFYPVAEEKNILPLMQLQLVWMDIQNPVFLPLYIQRDPVGRIFTINPFSTHMALVFF